MVPREAGPCFGSRGSGAARFGSGVAVASPPLPPSSSSSSRCCRLDAQHGPGTGPADRARCAVQLGEGPWVDSPPRSCSLGVPPFGHTSSLLTSPSCLSGQGCPAAGCEPLAPPWNAVAGQLALGPLLAMENQVLVIRIKIPNSGAVDWTVHSGPQLLFRDVLDVIGQVLPEATTTAFEYEDEDGDRITVRSDEEMKAMLSYYYSTVMEQQVNGQLIEPLQIFPRACKPPGERNIHGLKVNTRAGPSQHSSPAILDSLPGNSLKKSSAELKKILANGQMNEQDIRYRDTLGHGNGGTVYKAYHVPSGKILAVKVILLDITLELQKQIMSELEILYKCDSSYIIGFYGAFFVENRISICTEFMDGGSLDVYRKIPEHVLGRIAVAVVKGLTYLWSLKILHRDVKPSNMLVNTRGQIKLCDFGVSTQLVNSIAKTYVGTNAYMAPERISGEQYGIHSDVWSLGISFMELALGRFPYPQIQKNQGSLMPLQLLQCIVDEDSPVLPVGEFSEPFVHFITQCMRKQPKERPAPEELMGHPFLVQFDDGNATVVSMWVCRVLEDRRSQQGPP
ncbi:dual specificity mitogen-activated protein kinase kinase 5 [Suncus etruscus]|uniref:dual specificity mitogen-activated protein kinase kinase 5 n=1 Tax=Suncus etruscus TaxID=109475 RepID=UPI0021105A84|nr:dual specificity mitogen-activated protein kinase kinase 5 [Suncus etruscus]